MFPYKTTFQPVGEAPTISQATENQWSNPSNYQVDLDTVDWAALAQQWITMKEACSTSPVVVQAPPFMKTPLAPPPPNITKPSQHDLGEEQGEAPMEVEHDEDEQTTPIDNNNLYVAPPAPVNIFHSNQSNNGTATASTQSNLNSAKSSETKPWHKKGSRRNNSHAGHTNDSKAYRQPHSFRGDPYNTISPQVYNLKSNESPWQMANPVGALPPAATSHAHADSAPTHHTDATQSKSGTHLDNVDLMPSTLDAAQRKTLPAWIREGLEKMERGKQKEADRMREAKERDEKQRQIRLAESTVISLNPGGAATNIEPAAAQLLLKSKFESDSDDDSDSAVDDVDHRGGGNGGDDSERKKSVADAIAKAGSSKASAIIAKPYRSKADILQDIMLSVRKNLTEILLEVTNEQINDIANETLSKMRSKGLKAQTVQKNALTAITGGLGLVTYDDSDGSKSSSESDEDEPERSNKSRNDDDSDNELMMLIGRRKAAFEIKSAEIEEYLAQNDEREKNWLEKDDENSEKSESTADSANGTPSAASGNLQKRTESGEIQQDKNKLTTSSGRKTDRKSSRFSDAKGLVYNVANSMATMTSALAGQQSIHTSNAQRPDASRDSENSSDSMKKSSHASKSHHSSKHERSDRSRRSSSSSKSRNSRRKHSRRDRSHSRHRHRSRSSSTDRASKSSKSSRNTRDIYSKEKSYSRSHSHRSSKKHRTRSRSRSRSRSYESRSSHHRHR